LATKTPVARSEKKGPGTPAAPADRAHGGRG